MIKDLAFNQDFSCLLVLTGERHRIFNCDPFGEFYVLKDASPTAMLRMLFSTLLTIVVPESGAEGGNRVLKVYNLKQNLKICELTFPLHIVDLMLNRKRLLVFLEVGQIFIYDLSSVRLIKVLEINSFVRRDDAPAPVVADLSADDSLYLILPLLVVNSQTDLFNSEGSGVAGPGTPVVRPSDSHALLLASLVAFSQKNASSLLSKTDQISLEDLQRDSSGWILVYDTLRLVPRLIYKAHDSAIARVTVSNDSKCIATASTKGTIIRVCHIGEETEPGAKLSVTQITNLRRGHNLTRIGALRFNLDLSILGCGLDSHTIHFFNVNRPDSDEHVDEAEGDNFSSDEEGNAGRSSQEDLDENLANLLLLKRDSSPEEPPSSESRPTYLSAFRRSSKLLNNLYTKLIIKKLPYRDYFDNLIWEKPRRSFAYIKLPEYTPTAPHPNNVEIGFSSTGLLMLASYNTGTFYHYQLPKGHGEREECSLLSLNSLLD